jgi:tetratricopeptide (TPR) repeat protein
MKRSLFAGLICAVTVLPLSQGQALAASDQKPKDAQRHSEKAELQFDLGHWDAALAEYEAAYESDRAPIYLYKMAETCRRKGDTQRAIDLYKNYQEKAPGNPQKAEVDEKIRVLSESLTSQRPAAAPVSPVAAAPVVDQPPLATPTAAPSGAVAPYPAAAPMPAPAGPPAFVAPAPAPPPPPLTPTTPPANGPRSGNAATVNAAWPTSAQSGESSTSGLRIFGAILAGVGVASIGVGGYFSWRTDSLESSVKNASTYDSAQYDSGKQAQTLQWVFYGAGAGAAVLGVVLYAVGGNERQPQEKHLSLIPTVWSNAAGLSAQGGF